MVKDRKMLEHKYQIISKKNLNYAVCKMDSKSKQSISGNSATGPRSRSNNPHLTPKPSPTERMLFHRLSSNTFLSERHQ